MTHHYYYYYQKTYGLRNRKNKFHFVTDYGNKKEALKTLICD